MGKRNSGFSAPGRLPTVDIIIVNWNSRDALSACLCSVDKTNRTAFSLASVIIVDNASEDGSVERVSSSHHQVRVIKNQSNRGFAAACNQGAKEVTGDYLLFLNPDVSLFDESLESPLRFMENRNNEHYGICGIQLTDKNGHISRTCAAFPTCRSILIQSLGLNRLFPQWFNSYFMGTWPHQESRQVDHVIGAFFLVRRSLFDLLGGFDERFFVYLEDLDFSFRAHLLGFRSFYLADVQAYHEGGGCSEQIRGMRLFYSLRSRLLYVFKHLGICSSVVVFLSTLVLEPLTRICLGIFHRSEREILETLEAYARLLCALPSFLRIGLSK